jgi:hypothetical protein
MDFDVSGMMRRLLLKSAKVWKSAAASLSIIEAGVGLPCAFNTEGIKRSCFAFVEHVLQDAIDTAAARAAAKARAQIIQIFGHAGGNYLHITLFCIAYPAAKIQLTGLTVNKPTEANALDTAANEKVKHHKASVAEAD